MSRRSTPQAQLDEKAFPVRIRVRVPEAGFGTQMGPLRDWLERRVGRGDYAWHAGGRVGGADAVAIYFRDAVPAAAFLAAFPLELADGTVDEAYSSPDHPFGRREDPAMCNLYSMTKGQEAIRRIVDGLTDRAGNLPALDEIYPDHEAPIVRNGPDGPELVRARWGMPKPTFALKGKNVDSGVTNVRNTGSPHWRRWLGPEHRCLVPWTAFSEPGRDAEGRFQPIWFALGEDQPLAFFAGITVSGWTSVRKIREGEVTADLHAFLTTEPNAEVAKVHPKAMPVILRDPAEWATWLSAPWEEAWKLQRPLPDGSLSILSEAAQG